MDNLIDKIRGEQEPISAIASRIYNVDFSSSYIQLKKDVTNIVKRQIEFKRLVRSKSSIFHSSYYRLRKRFCERVLKRKQYTLDELFDIQLVNIGSLNDNLQTILADSRNELTNLEEYFEQINNEVLGTINSKRKSKIKEMEEKNKIYHKISNELRTTRKDAKYFQAIVTRKKLKRELFEYLHKHNLADELIINLSQESFFLDKFEDLLRISIHTCERIALKTAVLERHLANTKRTYQLLKAQQKTVSSLGNAVDTMTDFTSQLQNTLSEGLDKIVEIANAKDSYYLSSANNFNSLLTKLDQRYGLRS